MLNLIINNALFIFIYHSPGSKYWVDPEVRAKRIVNIAKYASVDFCKNYWFLGEVGKNSICQSLVLSLIIFF